MEIMLRCTVPDRPGALAALAGAVGRAGGDIEAVDVVETDGESALDDLLIVISPGGLPDLLRAVSAVEGVALVHAGPSRGHPSDGVTRLAVGLQSLLDGAMDPDHGVPALVGGLVRATSADWAAAGVVYDDDHTLVLPFGHRCLVLRREYRFTRTERDRALAVLRACAEAVGEPGR